MAMKLNPETGATLAKSLRDCTDGTIIDVIQAGYTAISHVGEGPIVDGAKEKFQHLSREYNESFLPAAEKVLHDLEEFTDVADYLSKLSVNTGVKGVVAADMQASTMSEMFKV